MGNRLNIAVPIRAAGLPLIAAGLVLAGCGGSTRTVSQAGPPTIAQLPAATATQGATQTAASTQPAGAPPTRVLALASFQSPSGNIGCAIGGGQARCDIVRRSWKSPKRPHGCPKEVDFGQGLVVVADGGSRPVCAGDTVLDPSSARLAYGTAAQAEGFECVSRPTGIACTERATGHGFELSRDNYRLF